MAGALALAATVPAHAEPPLASQTLAVRVDDRLGVPDDVLMHAKEQAAHIYSVVGLRLVWLDAPSDADADMPVADLDVKLIAHAMLDGRAFGSEVLGAAPRTRSEFRTAYIFWDRIDSLTRSERTDPTDLLAYVIAHEVGHLLLPVGSHAQAGLMRAHWLLREVEPTRSILLQFSDDEGVLIRQRAASLRRSGTAQADAHTTP